MVEGLDQVLGALGGLGDPEVAGRRQLLRQLAREGGVVAVVEHHGGVLDVGGDRVAEDDELDDGRDEDDPQGAAGRAASASAPCARARASRPASSQREPHAISFLKACTASASPTTAKMSIPSPWPHSTCEPDALEEDAAHRRDEVARRHGQRDDLQHLRHARAGRTSAPRAACAGRKVVIIASWVARNCDLAVALMKIPSPCAPTRKSIAVTIRNSGLPAERHGEHDAADDRDQDDVHEPDAEVRQQLARGSPPGGGPASRRAAPSSRAPTPARW